MGSSLASPIIKSGAETISGLMDWKGANAGQTDLENAAKDQRATAQTWYNTAQGNLQPYRDFGQQGMDTIQGWLKDPSSFISSDPGAQFRMKAAQDALERSAFARGRGLSGGTGRALTALSQDMATQDYANEWARMMGMVGVGQGATGALVGQGQNASNQIQNAIANYGNAQAAGDKAKWGALSNANRNIGNAWSDWAGGKGMMGGFGG